MELISELISQNVRSNKNVLIDWRPLTDPKSKKTEREITGCC